jgi:hypothetical protein
LGWLDKNFCFNSNPKKTAIDNPIQTAFGSHSRSWGLPDGDDSSSSPFRALVIEL